MRKKTKLAVLFVITLLTMSVLVSGCGKMAEKASEKAAENAIEKASGGNAKVDLDNKGNVEIKTDEGTLKAGSNEWPKQLPSDVPRFKDGKITSVVENSANEEGKGIFIGIENAGLDAADKYKNELQNAGWSISSSASSPEMVMFGAQKDNREITVSFTISDGKLASGGVTYAEKK
ncbi:MAG TPA: hypothetical protein VHQ70_00270 [Syntrophomonadaceae bacterium]|nr:hypothetical protein [Syntrophomonadaceae bacterium]